MDIAKKSILFGFLSGLGLLAIYFIILALVNGPLHILTQLKDIWYWILLLVIGFGTQIGLYSFIKMSLKAKMATETGSAAASGGISTVSMIACCAHHLSDVLTLIGLSVLSVFLAQYQVPFIIVGIVSNVIGIILMLNTMKEHNLSCKYTEKLFKQDLKAILKIAVVFGILIIIISFLGTALLASNKQQTQNITNQLQTITLEENSVTFKITPLQLEIGKEMLFDILIDTHTTDLNFDLTKITILEDNKENKYLPTSWEGSAPGGHHRSGKLYFDKLQTSAKLITLIIKNAANVAERKFTWQLE